MLCALWQLSGAAEAAMSGASQLCPKLLVVAVGRAGAAYAFATFAGRGQTVGVVDLSTAPREVRSR